MLGDAGKRLGNARHGAPVDEDAAETGSHTADFVSKWVVFIKCMSMWYLTTTRETRAKRNIYASRGLARWRRHGVGATETGWWSCLLYAMSLIFYMA